MITSQEERLTRIFGEGKVRRSRNIRPDKVIIVDRIGTEELCHHTGFEILDGENRPANWWAVFEDVSGKYHLDK